MLWNPMKVGTGYLIIGVLEFYESVLDVSFVLLSVQFVVVGYLLFQ